MVSMPHWPASFANLKHRNNLNNLANVLKLLGNPQENLPPVIQVAGTNGKGSVCAFLKSILTMHGYKIHRYTSPHITRFNERIEIANKQISDHALFAYLERVRIICPDNNYLSFCLIILRQIQIPQLKNLYSNMSVLNFQLYIL